MPWAEQMLKAQVEPVPAGDLEGRALDSTQAVNEALSLALELDPKVFVMGQGVDDPGGMFGITKTLSETFGARRVFDTPLSEDALTGISVGASMNKLRPVYLHNRPDFILLTFNQLVNHASKAHWMDVGQVTAPMVVWAAIGRGWGSGPQHSQAIQGLLLSVPGLKIVMPSTPYDAKGLMLAAIADNNPVIIFEHRWLMKQQGVVPEGIYQVPLGKGICRREGTDVSIVGTSHMISMAMQAAIRAEEELGISVEVIDLRTIKPLDEEIILASARKTGRVIVVDTGWQMGGVCAEVSCCIAEKAFDSLKKPVVRIGLPDVPTPAGYTLEQYYYPDVDSILDKIRQQVN